MAMEQQEITQNIKQYLQKTEKFAVRMSAALSRSKAFKSNLKSAQDE
jgi:hypothetical protein